RLRHSRQEEVRNDAAWVAPTIPVLFSRVNPLLGSWLQRVFCCGRDVLPISHKLLIIKELSRMDGDCRREHPGMAGRPGREGRAEGAAGPADAPRCWSRRGRNRSARCALSWQPAAHIPSPCSAGTTGVVDVSVDYAPVVLERESCATLARCERACECAAQSVARSIDAGTFVHAPGSPAT